MQHTNLQETVWKTAERHLTTESENYRVPGLLYSILCIIVHYQFQQNTDLQTDEWMGMQWQLIPR